MYKSDVPLAVARFQYSSVLCNINSFNFNLVTFPGSTLSLRWQKYRSFLLISKSNILRSFNAGFEFVLFYSGKWKIRRIIFYSTIEIEKWIIISYTCVSKGKKY